MFNESPRLAKLIGAGLTVLAMGVGGVAMADAPTVQAAKSQAAYKATPQKQSITGADDGNNGFRCDGNNGIGKGNPAFTTFCPPSENSGNPTGTSTGGNVGTDSGTGAGTDSGTDSGAVSGTDSDAGSNGTNASGNGNNGGGDVGWVPNGS